MTEIAFEALHKLGKVKTRYAIARTSVRFERFKFWSANEEWSKLWLPKYVGHAVLHDTTATIRINDLRTDGTRTATVYINPGLRPYAASGNLEHRLLVGSAVVASAIAAYLDGTFETTMQAQVAFAEFAEDAARQEAVRILAVTAR
jgi:hypothetical protein